LKPARGFSRGERLGEQVTELATEVQGAALRVLDTREAPWRFTPRNAL
jgi:hypothetical protein